MFRVKSFTTLLPCLCLLYACGGSSSQTTSGNDNSSPEQPAPISRVISITGEGHIAPAFEHRLYASSDLAAPHPGTWTWSIDEGENLLLNWQATGDVISFTPRQVESVHTLTFSVIYREDNAQFSANKSLLLHPGNDPTMAPMVSAGDDFTTDEGSEITLRAHTLAKGGRSIRRLHWQQLAGPQAQIIGATDQDQLVVKLPQISSPEVVQFTLSATDSGGFTAENSVVVSLLNSLPNQLPVVDAGPAQQALGRESVKLSAQANDPDGEIVALQWRALAPFESLAIENANNLQARFIAPNVANTSNVTLRLRATDNQGGYSEGDTAVTVSPGNNAMPSITSFSVDPGVAYSGETVKLYSEGIDTDGDSLSFLWEIKRNGQLTNMAVSNSNLAEASFVVPDLTEPYSVDVVLTVSDGRAASSQSHSVQLVSRQQAAPDMLSCVSSPLQKDCPLYPLADLLDASQFSNCDNPLDESCILGDIMGPALRQCLQEREPELCREYLQQLYDPSYVLEQLGAEEPANKCTPAYDEQSFEHYIGSLHEHTGYSDGVPMTRPADVYREVSSKGYDFAGSSDHSDTLHIPLSVGLDRAECPPEKFLYCVFLVDEARPQDALAKWAATLTQANDATTPDFTAIRGFEWTSDRFGHANVYFSQNFINAKTGPGYAVSMLNFWQWFTYPATFGGGSDGLLSFNHPGREDALEAALEFLGGDPAYTFNDFRYVPAADYRTVGIEVFGKGSEYDSDGPNGSWFSYALDKGWHLAPISSEDHHGLAWGDGDLPKTVMIARSRALDDLREAMLARRAYAVAQNYNDVRTNFSIDSEPMGSRLRRPIASKQAIYAEVLRQGQTMPNTLLQLVGPGNVVIAETHGGTLQTELSVDEAKTYLFLRVLDTSAQNRPIAFTAPIWIIPGAEPLPTCLPPAIWSGDSVFYPAAP